jgi:hypothetical protein
MKLLVPLLALVTLFAVGFVLVGLRAPLTPSSSPSPTPSPPPIAAPPVAAPPVAAPPVTAPVAAPRFVPNPEPPTPNPEPPATDPLDVIVRGKTRREWHAYYAERQQETVAEMQRHQAVVDRAIAGEEPDPRELANAHDRIRELNAHLKEDLEALQLIDGNP